MEKVSSDVLQFVDMINGAISNTGKNNANDVLIQL